MIIQLQGISTFVAIWGCIFLERRLHSEMQKHQAMFKLFSFKAVAGLDGLQQLIFPILGENRIYMPSPPFRVSWNDFTLALPNFIVIWELTVVAIIFLWSFEFARYKNFILLNGEQPKRGARGALRDVLNIWDIWEAVAYAFFHRVPHSWLEGSVHGTDPLDADMVEGARAAGVVYH
jgi:hypothetical protein